MGRIFIAALLMFAFPISASCNGVELHAHLFMKEGMTWLFRGHFNEPMQATSWSDRYSSQANPKAMDQSGLDIVVATLYAHPLFTFSLRDSIRSQINLAHQFVLKHPNWILANNPDQAKTAIQSGKHVLILALEGAAGILENDEDFREFVDQGGIRIVTPLHLTDDEFGGVAFLHSYRILSSPIAFLKSLFSPVHDNSGARLNPSGLSPTGRKLALSLIQHRVWIDLAHSSDASQQELVPLMIDAGQPLLYTHTVLRRYLRAERAISDEQLHKLAETHGIIGLMPSEEMLEGTQLEGPCQEGIYALATQYKEAAKVVDERSVGIGSDFNGTILHLKPSSKPNCNVGTPLDQEGFWNIGQSQALWQTLEKLGAWHPSRYSPHAHTEEFLQAWSKVWSQSLRKKTDE